MAHTRSRYQQDLGFADGVITLSPLNAVNTGDAGAWTRNGVGDYSLNWANAKAPVLAFNLGEGRMFRTGISTDTDYQEQYGGAGPSIPDASFQGRPDTLAAMANLQEITPLTAAKLKGLKLLSVAVAYQVGTTDLQAFTARLDKTVLQNNVAPPGTVTNLLADGQNGLVLVQRANMYVVEIALPAAAQVYQVTDLSQFWFELAMTTGAAGGSTARIYGVRVKVEFNFN